MEHSLPYLLGEALGLWWMVALLVFFTIGISWPLMAWSAMRNIKGIRRQLERLNDTLEARGAGGKGGILGL